MTTALQGSPMSNSADTWEGVCEGDDIVAMQMHLSWLYQAIERLMQATFEAEDDGLKSLLASLESRARRCKQAIEKKLACRN